MATFFPDQIVEQVRQSNDIVDLISEYLPLKKKGKNFWALCPFHIEKTPSFSVNQDKQIFYCFGCGQGGNSITFLMTHEKLSFPEALKLLAKRAGISLPAYAKSPKSSQVFDKLYLANQVAQEYFQISLENKNLGKKASDYLAKRKITEEIGKLFCIGYAPSGWEGLIDYAKTKNIGVKTLNEAGLVVVKSDTEGYYDRFRNRIMFPIFSLSGKVIGFGGRALSEEEVPKYLNSPETFVYQKGKILYGLNLSKEFISATKEAILVEGYIDLLSLYQAGIKNVVASSGTAFTEDQARLLSRYAEMVYLMFDSDLAGVSATLRSVEVLLDAGLEVKIVPLPAGEDPDTLVKKVGPDELMNKVKSALDFVEFKKQVLEKESGSSTKWGKEKEKTLHDLVEISLKIKNDLRRELFLHKVSEVFEVSETVLRKILVSKKLIYKKRRTIAPEITPLRTEENIEKELLKILLEENRLIEEALKQLEPEELSFPETQQALSFIYNCYKNGEDLTVARLLDRIEDEKLKDFISEVALIEFGEIDLSKLFADYLRGIKNRKLSGEIERLKRAILEAEKNGDLDLVEALSFQLQNNLRPALENR